jgi:hypothetical protein
MNIFAAALAAALLAAPASAQDSGSDHWDARITAVTGEVVVHPAGGGDEVAGDVDMPLEEGDRVVTSAGATAEIALDGGSLISLREGTDFTLENTQKSASIFSVALGSIMAKIQKLGSQSLSVRSPTSVAAVRGTEFAVDVEDGQSHVGVFDEGRVEVKGQSGGMTVLTPNQETSVSRGLSPMRARPLQRFAARRELMRAHVQRLAAVRQNWKTMPMAQRRQMRSKALKRLRQRRLNRQRRMRSGQIPDKRERREEERRKPRRKAIPKAKKRALKRRPAPHGQRPERKAP